MNQVMISADSTCDLPVDLQRQRHVYCFALSILLGDTAYADGVEIRPADIYADVAENHRLPKTAAVPPGVYYDKFKQWTDAGCSVVHIGLSSAISSSYQNACTAAAEFENVYVVDSRNLSTGIALLVLDAAERAEKGEDPKEIAALMRETAKKVEASFVIDTLFYLQKGGRCSTLAALGANLLKLKPCIEVKDGKMGVGKKYRGKIDNCIAQYVRERLQGRDDLRRNRIFITHSGCAPEIVENVKAIIKECGGFDEVLETYAGCTVSSHCGPNTLGVLFLRK